MSKKKPKAPSRGEELINSGKRYLRETTVHGFRYVADGNNFVERIFWIFWIICGFSCSYYMVSQSVLEDKNNPILTTIDTISVTTVPFPAVTVDGGIRLNPWGYITKIYNQVFFECYEDPFGCAESQKVRQDFRVVIQALVERYKDHLDNSLRRMTLETIEKIPKTEGIPFLDRAFDGSFKRTVAILAALEMRKPQSYSFAIRKILQITVDKFASFVNKNFRLMPQFGRIFEAEIIAIQQAANVTDEEVDACEQKVVGCLESFKTANIAFLLPFKLNRIPYDGLGFGDFLSTFIRRVVSSRYGKDERGFLMNKSPPSAEREIHELFINLTNNLAGKDIGLSPFELSLLVDQKHSESESTYQAARAQGLFDCTAEDYSQAWKSWEDQSKIFAKDNTLTFVFSESPCQNETEAKYLGIQGCCRMRERFENELELILKIMQHGQQPPVFRSSIPELGMVQRDASLALPYTLVGDSSRPAKVNLNPRVFECQYNKIPSYPTPNNCNWFSRSFTDEGIGYSFNTGPFWDHHQVTDYNSLFYRNMFPDERISWDKIAIPETSGKDYGLSMTLQLNDYLATAEKVLKQGRVFPVFKVAIHDPNTPADLRSGGIEIEPGYLSTFLITPSETATSEAVKELEPTRRECRFKSEIEGLKIFKQYTQTGCILECKLTAGAAKCGCIPWNYPHLESTDRVCDFHGSTCFERIMANSEQTKDCDCPFDCDSIRYTYSVSSTAIDKDKICSADSNNFSPAELVLPSMLQRSYDQNANSSAINMNDICKANLKKVAMVKFQLSSKQVTRIKRDIRVTVADMISTFGGTIGLFTGMSILSVIEAIFWLGRVVTGARVQ
eukprot:maker-scaffold145_size311916-snap-gene-1.10 protein:Tk09175 transcript:maker-scaffold145_size311916-snap-gene-1.10-mRNA-1 annotation:"GE16304"